MWYRYKDRHIDRLESPEIYLCIYGQVIFDKDAKTIQQERTVFSTNDVAKLDIRMQ